MSKKSDGKKGKAKKGGRLSPDTLTLSRHSRARNGIRRARARAGLIAFVLVIFLSARAGLPAADAWLRGLMGAIVAYVATWGVAVVVWRHLAVAEVEAAHQRILETRRAATQAMADAAGGRSDG
jgi:hypothetical protein